jgi:hypothetical protein
MLGLFPIYGILFQQNGVRACSGCFLYMGSYSSKTACVHAQAVSYVWDPIPAKRRACMSRLFPIRRIQFQQNSVCACSGCSRNEAEGGAQMHVVQKPSLPDLGGLALERGHGELLGRPGAVAFNSLQAVPGRATFGLQERPCGQSQGDLTRIYRSW